MGDGCNLNRHAYQQLVDGDLEWLRKQPRTVERMHVIQIVEWSVDALYGDNDAATVNHLRQQLAAATARVGELEAALDRILDHAGAPSMVRRLVVQAQATPVADAGATTALCRYCGQSESNHHDGVGAARDCTFAPIEPYTPPTLSAETMQRGKEIVQRLVDRTTPAVDEQAAVERVIEAAIRWADCYENTSSDDPAARDARVDLADACCALRTRRASGEG